MKAVRAVLLVLVAVLASGCATGNARQAALEVRVASLTEDMKTQDQELAGTLDAATKELDRLEQADKSLEQVLTKKLEDAEKRIARLETDNRQLSAELDGIRAARANARRAMAGAAKPVVDPAMVEDLVAEALERQQEQRRLREEARETERREEWRQRGEERARQWETDTVDRLARELQLTDEQKGQVRANISRSRETMRSTMREMFQAMREEGNFDRAKVEEAMDKLTAERRDAMKTVLSAEQHEKYIGIEDEFLGRMRSFMDGMGGPERGGGRRGRGGRRGGD